LGIKGNPNFGLVRTLMVVLKAMKPIRILREKFNELRIADMDNQGGSHIKR
jgi:hypothetical protein